MPGIVRKKATINATVPPRVKDKALKFLETHPEFTSMSDLVAESLDFYVSNYGEKTETFTL